MKAEFSVVGWPGVDTQSQITIIMGATKGDYVLGQSKMYGILMDI